MLNHKNTTILSVIVLLFLIGSLFFIPVSGWFFTLLFIVWLGITTWGSFDIRLGYFTKTKCNNSDEKERKIAISFDDGPNPMTENVLLVLEKHQVKATFFCIGSQIEKYPEIFTKIINQGHTIGNHTYTHTKLFGLLSTKKVIEEISKTSEIITRLSGKKEVFFRPPFGVTNPKISRAIKATKHTVIGWNIRSLDTVIDNEETILKRIKNKIKPGAIILLHDTSLKTVDVLDALLNLLQKEKYHVLSVDKLLKIPAYEN